jgi:nucleotide-binding universal stress UspA family protein
VPKDVKIIRKINESANPADLILETTEREDADLVVVGTRGRSRLTEAFVGSVSARVFLHASRSTLVVKGAVRKVERVLVAVEGQDDADRIVAWLTRYPLNAPTELRVFHAVAPGGMKDEKGKPLLPDEAHRQAERLVQDTAARLAKTSYKVSTKVGTGKPVSMIEEQAKEMDLVVVSSHGRTGISRFLVGSVSHSIVHDVACSVLIVR